MVLIRLATNYLHEVTCDCNTNLNRSERDLRSCEVTFKSSSILYQFTHMIFIIYTLLNFFFRYIQKDRHIIQQQLFAKKYILQLFPASMLTKRSSNFAAP